MIKVEGNQVYVDTRTLKATFDAGVLVSLVRKRDGRAFIQSGAEGYSPLRLVYTGRDLAPLGGEAGDHVMCLPISDNSAEIRFHSWNGDGVLSISEDQETGDLMIEPGGYASRPGLRACRWMLTGIELIQLNKLNSEGDWWEAWSGSETLTKQHKSQEKPAKR